MDNNAFSAGVEPGGLRTQGEIKLLLCYLLKSVNCDVSDSLLLYTVQKHGLANYFETKNALADLVANESIQMLPAAENKQEPVYCIAEKGALLADSLASSLPRSVREKAVNTTLTVMSHAKLKQENQVEFHTVDRGVLVECHISDGVSDMMTITIRVPDMMQANEIKKRFQSNPLSYYRAMTALLAGEKKMVRDVLLELDNAVADDASQLDE